MKTSRFSEPERDTNLYVGAIAELDFIRVVRDDRHYPLDG